MRCFCGLFLTAGILCTTLTACFGSGQSMTPPTCQGDAGAGSIVPMTIGCTSPTPSSSTSSNASPAPNAGLAPIEYVAIGDSLTYGTGSTNSDSSPSTWVSTTSSSVLAHGYAQDFAVQIANQRAPAVLQFDLSAVPGDSSANLAGLLAPFPNIVSAARARGAKLLVTIFMGFNDGSGYEGVGGDVRQGQFYKNYLAAMQTIQSSSPDAVIAIGIFGRAGSQEKNTAIQDTLVDAKVTHGVFLDLGSFYAANPQDLGPAYTAPNGHPNDAGYAVMEQQLYQLYTASFPNF